MRPTAAVAKGVETINTVISKVYDDDLALDLNRQAVHFLAFEDKAAEEIRKASERPEALRQWERRPPGRLCRPLPL
ncbi:MAG: hypothetical protein V8Q27_01000 [Eubacteriales bacterium]